MSVGCSKGTKNNELEDFPRTTDTFFAYLYSLLSQLTKINVEFFLNHNNH